jgi:hypothetical protein
VAHGCAASACNVERVEGGFKATGQIRRMDTGQVIAEAEGFVGEDEAVWFGGTVTDKWGKTKTHPKRPDFAIRAMAQTRAISRACRSAFAHVVVQIDKNLGTTPAEEMQGVFDHDPEPHVIGGTVPQVAPGDAHLIRKDAIGKDGEIKSQYQIDKRKAAIAAGWAVTNTTPRGQISQVFDYMDMAKDPDEVAKILNVNVAVIEASGKADEVNEGAERLLRWFEKEAAGGKAA